MNKILMIVGIMGIAIAAVSAQTTLQVGPRNEPPKINPGDKHKPAGRPTDGRQVAVLNVQFEVENGKVREAALVEAKRISSIAPKVFARKSGDWEVRINGDKNTMFYVFNPIYLEAETKEGSKNPYTYVAQEGTINWSLVVPLYKGSTTIDAKSIVIIDRQSGITILDAAF